MLNIKLGQKCLVSGLKGIQTGFINEIDRWGGMFMSCGKMFMICSGEEVGECGLDKNYATPLPEGN
jgi:hypothetical protein